jgi:undecaprenyl-diphosphatase
MNNEIFFKLYSLAHQSIFLDWLIIFSAKLFGIIMIVLAVLFLFFQADEIFDYRQSFLQLKNKIKEISLIFFPAVFAWLIASVIKYFVSSPRPFIFFENVKPLFLHGAMDSFPSGHATFFSALAVSLFLKPHRIGFLYILVALIISLARVASGIHFPIDILAGWLLGTTIALIFGYFFKDKR